MKSATQQKNTETTLQYASSLLYITIFTFILLNLFLFKMTISVFLLQFFFVLFIQFSLLYILFHFFLFLPKTTSQVEFLTSASLICFISLSIFHCYSCSQVDLFSLCSVFISCYRLFLFWLPLHFSFSPSYILRCFFVSFKSFPASG